MLVQTSNPILKPLKFIGRDAQRSILAQTPSNQGTTRVGYVVHVNQGNASYDYFDESKTASIKGNINGSLVEGYAEKYDDSNFLIHLPGSKPDTDTNTLTITHFANEQLEYQYEVRNIHSNLTDEYAVHKRNIQLKDIVLESDEYYMISYDKVIGDIESQKPTEGENSTKVEGVWKMVYYTSKNDSIYNYMFIPTGKKDRYEWSVKLPKNSNYIHHVVSTQPLIYEKNVDLSGSLLLKQHDTGPNSNQVQVCSTPLPPNSDKKNTYLIIYDEDIHPETIHTAVEEAL